jgi:hypothetical protein
LATGFLPAGIALLVHPIQWRDFLTPLAERLIAVCGGRLVAPSPHVEAVDLCAVAIVLTALLVTNEVIVGYLLRALTVRCAAIMKLRDIARLRVIAAALTTRGRSMTQKNGEDWFGPATIVAGAGTAVAVPAGVRFPRNSVRTHTVPMRALPAGTGE